MGFAILYSIKDEKGNDSTTTVNLPTAIAFTDVALFAGEMAQLINPIITGQITRIGVAFVVDLPSGLRAAPASGSDVEEGGKFQYRTDGGFLTSMRLPTFDESKIQANSRVIDQADTDVAAYIAAMLSGIDLSGVGGSGVVQPSDPREDDITGLEFAREQFQSSRS